MRLLRPTLLALSLCTAVPVLAQDFAPVVIVNNAAVTGFEIDQRMRMLQILQAPGGDRETVERELVNERLKVQEARRMGLAATDAAVQAGMEEFAGRANLDAASFIAALRQEGVEEQTFRDFVAAGVVWREVLRARVATNIRVTDREIDQALKRVIETPKVTEVLISELIMPAPPGSEDRVTDRAEELARTITTEAAFAAAARQFSATPSAGSGGRLPWTQVANLPQGLAPILLSLKPGQVTPPLTIPGAVVLFYLRDTRGTLRPGAKAEVVEYARVTLPSVAEAARVQASAESCDLLYTVVPATGVERQTAAPSALPAEVAMRLASLDPNEGVVVDRGGAADLLMLCKRTPALLADGGAVAAPPVETGDTPIAAEDAIPDREQAREAIFNRKVEQGEATLLSELRANAIIRKR